MNRSESLEMWRQIARGDLADIECDTAPLLSWLQAVASKVVEADSEPTAAKRTAAIVSATGLRGVDDKYAALYALIDTHLAFEKIADDGSAITQTRAEQIADVVTVAQSTGLLTGIYLEDDKKAKDLIRSLWPKSL